MTRHAPGSKKPEDRQPEGAPPGAPLVVIAPEPGPGPWEAVVATLSEVLGLEPAREGGPAAPDDPELVDRILERAARVPGPVLILPPAGPAAAGGPDGRSLERVLVPFDASDQVSAAVRPLLARLQAAGVTVAQLHVVTAETVPPMWDGSGHHARAWHAELRRRHQVGDASMEVVSGTPAAPVVVAHAGESDLVVLCWRRPARKGSAKTLRGVLSAIDVPLLLVPLG